MLFRSLAAGIALLAAPAALAAGPAMAAPRSPDQGPSACRRGVDEPDSAIGPRDAPRSVRAFVDPVDEGALLTYVELRRLVADEGGRLRIELYLARGDGRRQPPQDRIRRWAIAMASADTLEPALRELARDGAKRMVSRLGTVQTRKALAADLGMDPTRHERLTTQSCLGRVLERNTNAVAGHFAGNPMSIRLPVFEIDDAVFDDAATLDRLRPELARHALSDRDPAPPPSSPLPKATSPVMRRPELGGVLLGGPGLPHRFVLQARDEEDASLFMMLPTVLAVRRGRPGRLSVHVVARGSSLGAATLRHRLCAARELGREVAYLEVLASDPPARERPPRDVVALLRALDEVPEKRCADEPDPAQLDLPDGQWLDGLPRARAELANLEGTLLLLDRAARPLSGWLGDRSKD